MITGWNSDEHFILFEEQSEAIAMTKRYGIHERIPEHTLIGLRGWTDFLLMNANRLPKTVPTIPLITTELSDWRPPNDLSLLQPDTRTDAKIKWHVTPIIFGGSPTDEENVVWVTIDQHVDLVRWWNAKYDEIRSLQA